MAMPLGFNSCNQWMCRKAIDVDQKARSYFFCQITLCKQNRFKKHSCKYIIEFVMNLIENSWLYEKTIEFHDENVFQ